MVRPVAILCLLGVAVVAGCGGDDDTAYRKLLRQQDLVDLDDLIILPVTLQIVARFAGREAPILPVIVPVVRIQLLRALEMLRAAAGAGTPYNLVITDPNGCRATASVRCSSSSDGSAAAAIRVPVLARNGWTITSWMCPYFS